MQKSCEKALSEHKNSFLDEFMDNVCKFNEKQSQRFLNERFKKFRQAYAFEAKALPSPKEISAAIDSNFSKKIAKSKGWKSSKKTILLWIVFYYSLLIKCNDYSTFELDIKNWEEISKIIEIFTPLKCKYMFSALKKSNVQVKEWLLHEDNNLIEILASNKFGENGKFKWTKIAQALNQKMGPEGNFRLAKHCRERFFNHLNPCLRKGEWEVSEDIILLQNYLKYHKKWSVINSKLQGRNDNIVKNRFYKLMKMHNLMTKNRKSFNDEKILLLIEKLIKSQSLIQVNAKKEEANNALNLLSNNQIKNEKNEVTKASSICSKKKDNKIPKIEENPENTVPQKTMNNPKMNFPESLITLDENCNSYNKLLSTRSVIDNMNTSIEEENTNTDRCQMMAYENTSQQNKKFLMQVDKMLPIGSPIQKQLKEESYDLLERVMNEIQNINIYEQKTFKFNQMTNFFNDDSVEDFRIFYEY